MSSGGFPFQNKGRSPQGNGPPPEAEVSASALFRKLADTVPPHEVLPFPRTDDDGNPVGEYWLRVLSQAEIDDASIDAEAWVRRKMRERAAALKDSPEEASERPNQEAWREMFESARMVELIWRACRDKDAPVNPLFRTPDDIRRTLTPNEITSIVNSYDQLQHRYGPLFRLLSAEDLEAWLERLTKGGEEALSPFGLLSPGQMAQLIASMAHRWPRSATGSFLLGWQSESSTSASPTRAETTPAQVIESSAAEPPFTPEH